MYAMSVGSCGCSVCMYVGRVVGVVYECDVGRVVGVVYVCNVCRQSCRCSVCM